MTILFHTRKPAWQRPRLSAGLALLSGIIALVASLLPPPLQAASDDRMAYAVAKPGETTETFYLRAEDFISLTHGGQIFLKPVPDDIKLFEEPAIKNGLALLMKVRDQKGEVIGYAAELETFDGGTTEDGLTIINTHWIVVIPGRGVLYLFHTEDARDMFKEIVGPVLESGESWEGDMDSVSTMGPRADGRGIIKGGTGEFESYRGSWVEVHHTRFFSADQTLIDDAELRLFLTTDGE